MRIEIILLSTYAVSAFFVLLWIVTDTHYRITVGCVLFFLLLIFCPVLNTIVMISEFTLVISRVWHKFWERIEPILDFTLWEQK
jgi:hypothetical protein